MPNGIAGCWLEIERRLQEPVPEKSRPAVNIYRDIFAIWNRFQSDIDYSGLSWSVEESKVDLSRGKYLLGCKPLPLDRVLFRQVLLDVLEVAAKHYPPAERLLKRAREGPEGKFEPAWLYDQAAVLHQGKLQSALSEESWVLQAGLDPSLIGYLINMAAPPFYINFAAEADKHFDFSIWPSGCCPVCGRLPMMAKLDRESGARILECGLCHQQWPFPRLECPFCRNRDFQQQQFFYTDDFPGRRVQLCECCKGYLKTAVIKEIGHEVVLEIDNLLTRQLDSLAQQEGYFPGEELSLLTIKWQVGQ